MNIISNRVRGIDLRFVGYTRALELCARMNRENEVLDFIDEIDAGTVLYDIGACEGRFAIYAALRGIRCWAFEPEALNFQALMENIELNGDQTQRLLTPLRFAVGENCHAGKIKVAQPWAGGHQRVIAKTSRVDLDLDFTSEQDVQVVSLDDFITAHNLPQPNYLKIDIDGSELPFVKGAMATLRAPTIKGVMFELHDRDENYEKILSLLECCGLAAIRRYEIDSHLFNVWLKRQNGR
jgi:FkbM family methyltransferase